VSNGITTMFHGVTWSWEPGLRGAGNARAVLGAIEALRPQLGADTQCHLRLETFNLDAEAEVTDWLGQGRVGMLGFNDHMPGAHGPPRTRKVAEMAARAGLSHEDFLALVERLRARADEVPDSITRLAAAAIAGSVALLSHDDMTPEQRQWFRARDCRLAEFPTTLETAEDATRAGDDVVMGAPNVVRGGSHIGWIGATDMIARGFCTILASDYYYPAPLLAAFRLAADDVVPLNEAWAFVSERPARAAGLADRGVLEAGKRADLIVVDGSDVRRPKLVAAMAKGRFVHLAETGRLQ
jgi:alpha-D-ribose 1-methylphosphonate 5-triphosphate diphosphatase